MTDVKKAVEQIRKFKNSFGQMFDLADAFEKLGSIEQATSEVLDRRNALLREVDQAKQELVELAEQADRTKRDAEEYAATLRSAAEAEVETAKARAEQEAQALRGAAEGDAQRVRDNIVALEAKRLEAGETLTRVNSAVADAERKLDKINTDIAKLRDKLA
jgi:chromosome segregation ATPase